MKQNIDDLETTFKFCKSTGNIKEKEIDIELIKSLLIMSEKGLEFITRKSKDIPKDSTDWTFVFRDYYEALRALIEAYSLFFGIEADSHQCKNAYICHNHKELDLDWKFLEIVRLKRNAINYRGEMLKSEDWKSFEINFKIHINTLGKEIKKKLKEQG